MRSASSSDGQRRDSGAGSRGKVKGGNYAQLAAERRKRVVKGKGKVKAKVKVKEEYAHAWIHAREVSTNAKSLPTAIDRNVIVRRG
jgi:hypothetical protein